MHTTMRQFTYKHYRFIIRRALNVGYKFINFSEYNKYKNKNSLICLLRHDCDNDLIAAHALAKIEASLGIKSTYFIMLRADLYNALSIPSVRIIKEIIKMRHWIGLHFDEFLYRRFTPSKVASHVKKERLFLARELGVPVSVVSFHNPSKRVLGAGIKLDCLNTYDKNQFPSVHYLSDSNMRWREEEPSIIFGGRTYPRIQLNLHPEWWTKDYKNISQKWEEMFRHNAQVAQNSLLQDERVYTPLKYISLRD